MSGKKYVPEDVYLVCDKGVKPSQLKTLSYTETWLYGEKMTTKADKLLVVNFEPFGACSCSNGAPCTAPVTDWTNVTDKITVGGNELLLENSELPCTLGGTIKIFYTLADAMAALPQEEKSIWDRVLDIGKGYMDFQKGFATGLWKGLKGTVTGVADLVVWAGKHHPIYQMLNPQGYAEQLQKDKETFEALGNLAKKGGTWVYRNSVVNLLTDPNDYMAAQGENAVMFDAMMDKAADMSAEDWGDFAGQVAFEVVLEVGTAGAASALTAVKAADRTVDIARAVDKLEDLSDATKAADKLEDISDGTKLPPVPEELGDVVYKVDDMTPGSPAHKAQRWEDYKEGGGTWSEERWSKQYDTNMKNNKVGLQREADYRTAMGAESKTVKTPYTNRQIDMHNSDEMYSGQLKTGKVYHTEQAKIDIQKDAWLVEEGYKVEYILEGGASKPFIEALEKNGIDYKIGPQIPK